VTAKFERTTRVAREVIEMIGPPGGVERAQATNEL
jgi:hypothetical protein